MLKRLIVLIITFLFYTSIFAVGEKDSIPEPQEDTPKEMFYGPTVGLGVGMFKFYGDILSANYGNPLVSNIGYDLHVKQQLSSYLTAKFYVLFGALSANERSKDRNLNFRSSITVGGFALMYNFDHILPEKRTVSPFISLGIESIEFNSKTDLYDAFGNEYNYWSDGSIRNIAENDVNAADAIVIQRDYFYETDLRELNADNFGKYPERAFAVPVGVGATLHMTENIDFTVGTTLHFTFSDLIDNITDESGGERIGTQPGNPGNDKFFMSSFSISYNFLKHGKEEKIKEFEEDIDYLAYNLDDEDGDGVIDFLDECPWTPAGVEVDKKGCPLDKDGDFVPNYKDDELESRKNAVVNRNGVEMTDEMIFEAYQRYTDSTGMFAETATKLIAADKRKNKKKYKVQIGEFTGSISADLIDKFLSIPDVEFKTFGDTLTVIAVGDYDNLPEAIKRKIELTAEGFDAAIVVEEEKDGTLTSVGDAANNMNVNHLPTSTINSQGLIFRVQLGAFSKRMTKDYMNEIGNVIEIKGEDGLWKYLHGKSFKTMTDAANMKINLAIDYGIDEAFIVAYKNGKRIPLSQAGVTSSAIENINTTDKQYDKAAIKFKVQIGSYKNQLPTEVLSMFMSMEKVEQDEIDGGLTRYTAGGAFTSYAEAEAFKTKVVEAGIGGAFIIALHKDKLIPVTKAKEILKE